MLLPNTEMPKALQLAELISSRLADSGVELRTFIAEPSRTAPPPDLTGVDLVIVLGGDGTLLRAGHLCAPLAFRRENWAFSPNLARIPGKLPFRTCFPAISTLKSA